MPDGTKKEVVRITLRARPKNSTTSQPPEGTPENAPETPATIPARPTSEAPSITERTPSAADPDAPMTNSDGREL